MNAAQLEATGELARLLSLVPPTDPRAPSRLAPGLYPDLPAEVYHLKEIGVVNNGAISEVLRSPAHYLAWLRAKESRDREAFRLGSAAHARILEPERFACEFVVAPDFGPLRKNDDAGVTTEQGKANKIRKAEWMAERAGATIIDSAADEATMGMVESIARHPLASALLARSKSELTARWADPITGLPCKARADAFDETRMVVVDVKTTADASPDAFRRSIASYGYHRQAAHYLSGFHVLTGERVRFAFVAVEKEPPFAVAVYMISAEFRKVGRRHVVTAMRTIAECCAAGEFPAYPEKIQTLSPPRWAA